jgi:putative PIN family toxin of toxin-antitoxin system
VFDTNVLVSALLTTRQDSPAVLLLDYVLNGRIVLLYNEEILSEYDEVLHRGKFKFSDERIKALVDLVKTGLHLNRTESIEAFTDSDDRVFYEVALSQDGSYVVTGNLRHFPKSPIVVTPAQMLRIVEEQSDSQTSPTPLK